MPVLFARGALGRLIRPGDRVAVSLPGEDGELATWIGGSVLGFAPYSSVDPEALILLYPPGEGGSTRALASTCRRLGSSVEVAW